MKTCWVITNHYAGIINQALGLAEHLPVVITHKKVTLRPFWHLTSPYLMWGASHAFTKESDSLKGPFPDLVIAAGRQAILPALFVQKESKGATQIVYLQDPIIRRKAFDAIIAPRHDHVTGHNVIEMVGTTHRVTKARIEQESEKFSPLLSHYASPRVAVIIGGPNKNYRMDEDFSEELIDQLSQLQKKYHCSLLITTSRRTPEHVIVALKKQCQTSENVYLYTGEGANPYFAFLGRADHIILTCESVSMTSEVCATTKPVYLLPLKGNPGKFADFHKHIMDTGRVKWFDGRLSDEKSVKPFDEREAISTALQKKLQ